MSSAHRRDIILGSGVLITMVGGALLVARSDRPIRSKGPLLHAVQQTLERPPSLKDRPLPLFDAPCDGTRVRGSDNLPDVDLRGATLVLCRLEGGMTVGIREDRPTDFATAGVYPFPGYVLAGGSLAPNQGLLLYPDGDTGLRWTTSHRRARELSRSALYKGILGRGFQSESELPRLAFGHFAWPQETIEAEVSAGGWTVVRD